MMSTSQYTVHKQTGSEQCRRNQRLNKHYELELLSQSKLVVLTVLRRSIDRIDDISKYEDRKEKIPPQNEHTTGELSSYLSRLGN